MRILMLGAGGIGGYYGAKIHLAGGDVSFLVRPARAEQLKKNGLQVLSPFGDMQIAPKIVLAESLKENFDVIVLSCKAYDLDSAMDAIAPAMGVESVILPLLNGVRHIDLLRARFGAERVLGGVANISVTLDAEGVIHHLNQTHRLQLGALHTPVSPWLQPLTALLARFSSAWRKRVTSPCTHRGAASQSTSTASCLDLADSKMMERTWSSTAHTEKSTFSSSSRPDSIFDRSRMSLMMVSR